MNREPRITAAPIRKRLHVNAPIEKAFRTFTARMHDGGRAITLSFATGNASPSSSNRRLEVAGSSAPQAVRRSSGAASRCLTRRAVLF